MEKILSSNERVRRAEEIYARRQNIRERTKRATVNVSEPKNLKLLKRIILQIVICILIYFIFYLINTTNYSFSKITLETTEGLLSDDTDFVGIYNSAIEKLKGYFESIKPKENVLEENKIDENLVNIQQEEPKEEVVNDVNGVGMIENNYENEQTGEANPVDIQISETDRIKRDYSFILPINRKNNIRIWRKRK